MRVVPLLVACATACTISIPDVRSVPIVCPTNLPGPEMVVIDGAPPFCIDAREVSIEQYQPFRDDPRKPNPRPECTWNSDYANDTYFPGPTLPVQVNWCAAWSYCAWAGKRLCGKIGGGATPIEDIGHAAVSQWYRACATKEELKYPYGNTFEAGVCNDGTRTPKGLSAPGVYGGCVGGYPGIHDMSGNSGEWEDAVCENNVDGGADTDTCTFRGGTWDDDNQTDHLSCDARGYFGRSDKIGFRCCYPP
jgi:formylglycine-generating enzyme required for sulfatase activity